MMTYRQPARHSAIHRPGLARLVNNIEMNELTSLSHYCGEQNQSEQTWLVSL